MKKILFLATFLLLTASLLHAQNEETPVTKEVSVTAKKNIIKLNVLAFALKNISVEYERQISRKTTLAFTARVMPETGLPFLTTFQNAINDPITKLQVPNFRTSNYALMPQVRFYLGHKGAFHGFYIAPFVSYARYSGNLPYVYADSNEAKTIFLSGDLHAITGGIMFGAQWKIARSLYLDWWIAGPHYGFSKGQVNGRQPLSPNEQSNLKAELDAIDVPILKTTNSVDANGATVDFKGPWVGVRAGLCVGFRF
jgi:Protein of unknown function (DUF3575)